MHYLTALIGAACIAFVTATGGFAQVPSNPDNPNDPNTITYVMRRLYPDRYKDGYGVPRPSHSN